MANTTEVDNATLVHVSVKEMTAEERARAKPGLTHKLSIYPTRSGETVAFYSVDEKTRTHERPREVVWVGHGVPDKWRIEITGKNGYGPFPAGPYVLTNEKPARSGNAKHAPRGGETWAYNLTLIDDTNATHGELDPDIDIHPDP